MSWRSVARASVPAVLSVVLAGCGGGSPGGSPTDGGGGASGTTTSTTAAGHVAGETATTTATSTLTSTSTVTARQPGPMPCSAANVRAHCAACEWVGNNDGHEQCSKCKDPYRLDTPPEETLPICIVDCTGFVPKEKPAKPAHAQELNGIEWPAMCIPEAKSHFFTIGDWGGVCGWNGRPCVPGVVPGDLNTCKGDPNKGRPGEPCPMPNRGGGDGPFKDFEGRIQYLVSQRMQDRFKQLDEAKTPPRFVINVGDNFYPGGIDLHCGRADMAGEGTQFKQVWRAMYPAPLTSVEWWGVLGNHDYGGVCYLKGWDQQILHTWHDDKWVMPGQYWKRTVQYLTFSVDFFFVDGNLYDAQFGSEAHSMCSAANPGKYCEAGIGGIYPPQDETQPEDSCPGSGPFGKSDCKRWFFDLWIKNLKWLQDVVPKSQADWQIMVNHYPAQYNLGEGASWMEWKKFLDPMGIDLYIAGHTHQQKVYVGQKDQHDMGRTAWVVTGGGGGVTSESIPLESGDDDSYGFMDFEITLDQLTIFAYSHGGLTNKLIKRSETVTKPFDRLPLQELLLRGLILPEHAAKEDVTAFVF